MICHRSYPLDLEILLYGFLAAHALGLGETAMFIIAPAIQNSAVLRQRRVSLKQYLRQIGRTFSLGNNFEIH